MSLLDGGIAAAAAAAAADTGRAEVFNREGGAKVVFAASAN